MSVQLDTLNINFSKNKIKGEVKGISFKEGDSYIFYIPSLNLSSYGDTFEEAHVMMKDVVLPDFCNNALSKPINLLLKELTRLGWNRDRLLRHELSRAAHIDKNGILREFDLSPETVFEEENVSVC